MADFADLPGALRRFADRYEARTTASLRAAGLPPDGDAPNGPAMLCRAAAAEIEGKATPMPGWEGCVPSDNVVLPRALAMHWRWRLEATICADFCGGDGKCFERGLRQCERDLHRRTLDAVLGGSDA
ncbi:conserved protein of unknown function (plasmid) [Rhodovastum atsumiense]|uniref:Uncharacterized protein n=1 Tax=Rhodovastum atsumiense TaxID=504468 RepID=A0A5M6ITQ2_9PROT|nr:hypothetical protein [Rhodovastum atsumiense]KAA5611642.1 hypothetical protein F1189_13865 [Rhodovastum atsumiense]CAH2606262.1 conserved protein of unknown function [Rhodovastum atsumiense]